MIDLKAFKDIEAYIKEEDSQREIIIAKSRIILKNSKSAIYCLHRKELAEAKKLLDESRVIIKDISKLLQKYPHLRISSDNALEEYCEAECFYQFLKNKKVPSFKELGVEPYTYLAALSDLTGELSRKTVLESIAKNVKEVEDIRELTDTIYGLMSRLDLRNGELRRKYDAIKWNLNKIEDILRELKR